MDGITGRALKIEQAPTAPVIGLQQQANTLRPLANDNSLAMPDRVARRLQVVLLFLSALLAGLANGASMAETRTLVIAHAADLSGPGADFGRDFSLGAKIYFDHVNATGGVNGHRLLYRQADTGGSAAGSVAASQAFVKDGAQVLFGLTGDDTVAAVARNPAIRNAGTPLFGPVVGGTAGTREDGIAPLRTSLIHEMRALIGHLAALGIRSFGIAAASDYGRDIISTLEAELTKQSAHLVARSALAVSGDGPGRAAEAIAQARPQAVIVLADTLASALFVKRYRQLDPGAFLGAPSRVNIRTLVSAVGPEAARGLIVSQVVPNPGAPLEIAREHRRLMERYADEPASQATLEGFIAAKAMVQVLRRSRDLSNPGIQQAMREGGRFDLGGFELNIAKGERASSFVELTVVSRDGRLLR